jgi:hypothetical protein
LPFYQQAFNIFEHNDPQIRRVDTIDTMRCVATALDFVGRRIEARQVLERAHMKSLQWLGKFHLETAMIGYNLAFQIETSFPAEAFVAVPLYRAALKVEEVIKGVGHVESMATRWSLASAILDCIKLCCKSEEEGTALQCGQHVMIEQNKSKLQQQCHRHGGWDDYMEHLCGLTVIVSGRDFDGDVFVTLMPESVPLLREVGMSAEREGFLLNPNSLTLMQTGELEGAATANLLELSRLVTTADGSGGQWQGTDVEAELELEKEAEVLLLLALDSDESSTSTARKSADSLLKLYTKQGRQKKETKAMQNRKDLLAAWCSSDETESESESEESESESESESGSESDGGGGGGGDGDDDDDDDDDDIYDLLYRCDVLAQMAQGCYNIEPPSIAQLHDSLTELNACIVTIPKRDKQLRKLHNDTKAALLSRIKKMARRDQMLAMLTFNAEEGVPPVATSAAAAAAASSPTSTSESPSNLKNALHAVAGATAAQQDMTTASHEPHTETLTGDVKGQRSKLHGPGQLHISEGLPSTPLQTELAGLKLGALSRKAAESGATADQVEGMLDEEDPKAALIAFIVQSSK